MWHAFVFTRTAVTVRHWFEIGLQNGVMEHGSRLELRLLEGQEHRGSESAAQRAVLDRPIWRADLFDRIGDAPGTFAAAHFHSAFDGVEPHDREWSEELTRDPWAWASGRLARLEDLLPPDALPEDVARTEAADVRRAVDRIVAAARACSPAACTSVQSCHAATRDVADTVRLMVASLDDPHLLDRDHLAPWLDEAQA